MQQDGARGLTKGIQCGRLCLVRRTAAGTSSPLVSGSRGGGVGLSLYQWRELPGGQTGVIRENPLTHNQMFIKYMFWVEHYAWLSGVTKRLDRCYQQIDELQRDDGILNWFPP